MRGALLSVLCGLVAFGWVTTSVAPSAAARYPTALVPSAATASGGVAPGAAGSAAAVATAEKRPSNPPANDHRAPLAARPAGGHSLAGIGDDTPASGRAPVTTTPTSRRAGAAVVSSTTAKPPAATTPPTTGASAPLHAETTASGWGCGAAIAYLRTHAAPGFSFECPGSSLGHQAMTCIDVPGVCPGEKLIAITVPCPAAYMNEASNSFVLQHLSNAPIDPYGYCP